MSRIIELVMDSESGASAPRALTAPVDSARVVLDRQRDRAERMLNRARLIVLILLGIAALVYAPNLTPALNRVNVSVLVPILAWTILQAIRETAISALPGYDAAPWGWTRPTRKVAS